MGKRRLCTGIIIGASVGGLVSLLNGETREYVKAASAKAYDNAAYYANHPDVGVSKIKQSVTSLNQVVTNNTDSAMNALNQIEGSLQKFLK